MHATSHAPLQLRSWRKLADRQEREWQQPRIGDDAPATGLIAPASDDVWPRRSFDMRYVTVHRPAFTRGAAHDGLTVHDTTEGQLQPRAGECRDLQGQHPDREITSPHTVGERDASVRHDMTAT